jgi:hypothetical protein
MSTSSRFHVANLDETRLEDVRKLESELGKVIVALQPNDPIADLSDDQVAQVRALEEKHGIVIVAFDR